MRGIINKTKRVALFDFHRKNSDILIMQETHSSQEDEQIWEKEWGGKAFYTHGTTTSRGIAVFVTKEMFPRMKNVQCDEEGRIIIIDLMENNCSVTIAAIYAPNEDKPEFFRKLSEMLKGREEKKILIGDFNLTLDVQLDRKNTYCNNNKARDEVENTMDRYLLKDVWRERNGENREYSWFKSGFRSNQEMKASRIDLALVSAGLDQNVELITYLTSLKTDHRAIYMFVGTEPHERGAGYWKFNSSLLRRIDYVEGMKEELELCINSTEEKSPEKRWEIIKKRIKKYSVEFSRKKSSVDRLVIANLSEKVNEYEAKLPLTKEEDELWTKTKIELEDKMLERAEGVMFRSKARWQEEGEKNTKYFFSLEKARYNAKTCFKLIQEDQEITNPKTNSRSTKRILY